MSEILRITGRVSDLSDGLKVRRVLPAAARRAVGPMVDKQIQRASWVSVLKGRETLYFVPAGATL